MLLHPTDNLLLYGLSGAGKTTQAALVLAALAQETGKKALVYTVEGGNLKPIIDLANRNLAEIEYYHYPSDPFLWIDNVASGKRFVNGKWVAAASDYCAIAVESLSGMGDLVLAALGHQVADGKNVGGDAMKAPSLAIQADGYIIRVASNSPTHYGMAQKYLLEKVWQSQGLGVPVIWTAHEDVAVPTKRDDRGELRPEVAVDIGVQGMIGPLVAGHALTMHLTKYFVYTLRLKLEVKPMGSQHVLFVARHRDGLYEGLANGRVPFGRKIPERIVPANVVWFLQQLSKESV